MENLLYRGYDDFVQLHEPDIYKAQRWCKRIMLCRVKKRAKAHASYRLWFLIGTQTKVYMRAIVLEQISEKGMLLDFSIDTMKDAATTTKVCLR